MRFLEQGCGCRLILVCLDVAKSVGAIGLNRGFLAHMA